MKVVTPEISWHEKDPVYSIDYQPCTGPVLRIATGGVDKYVRIWQVKVSKDGKTTVDFLSNLKRHSKAVNVCRFSPDDAVILFWKLSESSANPGNLFEDEEMENKENWVVSKALRGHLEDIYDVCWSSDGKRMVSGSVDNSAILWDLVKDQKLALFNEHKSFVQGVAYDPLHEYFATLSADRSCRIFSTNGKNCMYNVCKMSLPSSSSPDKNSDSKPKSFRMFHDDTMRSFFRRLSFTVDGEILIAPAGCMELGENKVINSTYLFSRHSLNKPAVYLPSPSKFTICVRCCPCYFKLRKSSETENKPEDSSNNNKKEWEKTSTLFALPYRLVFAVGTEDSVLLYDTQQQSPFAYVGNIHYHQISDLAWSHDSRFLFVSSTDGYCTIITFDEGELGEIYVPEKEVNRMESSDSTTEKSKNADNSEVSSPIISTTVESSNDGESSSSGLNLVLEVTNDSTSPNRPSDITSQNVCSGKDNVTSTDDKDTDKNNTKDCESDKKCDVSTSSKKELTSDTPQPRRISFITLSNNPS
ncbi:hypothetical protein FSP39_016905 [Pinctada imbricata]|uniref:CAF1B/HIR1 beta-propeller domain-containing protein n=1 Tax=Pinctada imbricata TaxID=66713 RepID=A0AA88YJQ7_PINIB|nr:hypothetical protein FSP39_016905 [Pinctada imbricata]